MCGWPSMNSGVHVPHAAADSGGCAPPCKTSDSGAKGRLLEVVSIRPVLVELLAFGSSLRCRVRRLPVWIFRYAFRVSAAIRSHV